MQSVPEHYLHPIIVNEHTVHAVGLNEYPEGHFVQYDELLHRIQSVIKEVHVWHEPSGATA